jgi:thiamine-monophosphate kinase
MQRGTVSRASSQPGEFALIESLRARYASKDTGLIRGIGEDAAVIRTPRLEWVVLTTDLLAEGVHFDLATTSLEDVGYRAAASNLSDIASMGARPRYLLVAVAIPPAVRNTEVQRLYRGLMRACRPYRVHLAGGDTSASSQGLFISVTLTGTVEEKRALRRDGARPGDRLYVTGTLGDSRAGLMILTAAKRKSHAALFPSPRSAVDRFLLRRHHRPTARIAEGRWLAAGRLATAAIDLSDGLAGDVRHLCAQSRVGVEINRAALPISRPCAIFARRRDVDPADLALAGGEDYELLFTVRPSDQARLERDAARLKYRCTCIGEIKPASFGIRIRAEDGSLAPLVTDSYEHFRTVS